MSEEWARQGEVVDRAQGAAEAFVEWTPADIEQSIPQRLEQQVARHGARLALTSLLGTLTYEEFNAQVNRVAWAILDRLGPQEEPVAQVLGNDIPGIIGIFAAMKAGKMYVPLDLGNPRERTEHILRDSGARLLLADSAHLARAGGMEGDGVDLLNVAELAPSAPTENPNVPISPDRPAFIIYTSGSTGRP